MFEALQALFFVIDHQRWFLSFLSLQPCFFCSCILGYQCVLFVSIWFQLFYQAIETIHIRLVAIVRIPALNFLDKPKLS